MLNFVLFMKKDRELFAQHNNKAYICTNYWHLSTGEVRIIERI